MARNRKQQRRSGPASGVRAAGGYPLAGGGEGLPGAARPPALGKAIFYSELAYCGVLTCVVAAMHFTLARYVGALWRDEVQTINMGTLPTLREFWARIEIDTFPIVWHMVERSWCWLFGDTVAGWRVLGFLVGTAGVAALWWASFFSRRDFPVIALPLFAISPMVIRFGDALRGYGLGLAAMFAMIGAVVALIQRPTRFRVALGLATAILGVHTMYFNAVILLSLGAGSAVAALRRRDFRPPLAIGCGGLLAAASLLVYLDPMRRQYEWNAIIKYRVNFPWLASKVEEAMSAPGSFMVWVWLGLYAAAIAACVYAAVKENSEVQSNRGMAWFWGTALIFVVGAYAAFLYAASQPTNVWYYAPLLGFLAFGFDAAFRLAGESNQVLRVLRIIVAGGVALAVAPSAWHDAHVPATNVDAIAGLLEEKADRHDYIVVAPWWPGVAFTRYYHGPAPWTTLPDLGPLRIQRYDIFKQKMAEKEPIRPILERIVETLRGGHRVWLVGDLAPSYTKPGYIMQPDELPRGLPPIPEGPMNESPYLTVWSEQMTYIILHHSQRQGVVPVPSTGPAGYHERPNMYYERPNLWCFEGWR